MRMTPSSGDDPAAGNLGHERWGTLHPTLQQFDSLAETETEATEKHRGGGEVDPADVRTWFDPTSDAPAFYTPLADGDFGAGAAAAVGGAYPKLTYRQLRGEMDACPPWPAARALASAAAASSSASAPGQSLHPSFFSVGVLLPAEMMTELAVVHLCVMSGGGGDLGSTNKSCCSAPLDPRSSRTGLLSALDKMKCRALVATRGMMAKYDLGFLLEPRGGVSGKNDPDEEASRLERRLSRRVVDVRVIESGRDAYKRRDGSLEWTVLFQDEPDFDLDDDREEATWDSEDPAAAASASLFRDELDFDLDGDRKETTWDSEDPAAAASASLNATVSSQYPPLLLLRTSGTTSDGKAVPLTGPQLLFNARRQVEAMALTASDVTLNAMPLFHIGGLSCAFFSVLVSGGSAIYSGQFVPDRFLDQLCGGGLITTAGNSEEAGGTVKPTWYNAVPTMHRAILLWLRSMDGADAERVRTSSALRFVRSGAAPLDDELVSGLNGALLGGEAAATRFPFASSGAGPPRSGRSDGEPCRQQLRPLRVHARVRPAAAGGHRAQVQRRRARTRRQEAHVQRPKGRGAHGGSPRGAVPPHLGPRRSEPRPPLRDGGGDLHRGAGRHRLVPRSIPGRNARRRRVAQDGRRGEALSFHRSSLRNRKDQRDDQEGRRAEQVWPASVDSVVRAVDGVAECVTFGVPNKLWGEEVASAVVLENNEKEDDARAAILRACRKNLDEYAVPAQILFVEEGDLPKGPSGKYLRTRMAQALDAVATDTIALKIMEGQGQQQRDPELNESGMNTKTTEPTDDRTALRQNSIYGGGDGIVRPDKAIDGVRFVASIFVTLNHIGYFPKSLAIEKMRGFNVSVPIFFILAAFNLSLSVRGPIKWSNFVGTRIGQLHSLFVIAQIIALPSFLVFLCAGDSTNACSASFYWKQILTWIFSTLTGMFGLHNYSNVPTWFLTVIYQFIIVFPWVDKWARTRTRFCQSIVLIVFALLALGIHVAIFFAETPNLKVNRIRFTIIAFFPLLLSSMLAAYFFLQSKREPALGEANHASTAADDVSLAKKRQKKLARRWAVITDLTSLVLLALYAVVALTHNSSCIWLPVSTAASMRPNQPPYDITLYQRQPPLAEFQSATGFGQESPDQKLVKVCDISWDEYEEFLHDTPLSPTNGRFPTKIGLFIWGLRMGGLIALLWIYGLAKGHGITAKLMRLPPLLKLAPLSYHLYLLHVPISRYYYMATRPDSLSNRRFWYSLVPLYPMPIAWWEIALLVSICLILGGAIEQFLVPLLQPYTVKFGLWVCKGISVFFRRRNKAGEETTSSTSEEGKALLTRPNTEELITEKIRGLTGVEVTTESKLVELGLDSLGATALLSTLRSATPLADVLTVQDLGEIETIGELVDFLDSSGNMIDDTELTSCIVKGHKNSSPQEAVVAVQDLEAGEAGLSARVHRPPDGTVTIVSSRSSHQPTAVVVFCHGLGGTGESFINVLKILSDQMPHVKFILPTAPTRHVTMRGASMPAWYDVAGLEDRSKETCDGIDASSGRIQSILREQQIPYSRVVLAGFSQGGALSLFAGMKLNVEVPLAGIVLLSGYLPSPSTLAGVGDTPILHLHGDTDDIVPHAAAVASKQRALELGVRRYDLRTYPGLGHSVSPEEVESMLDFLRGVLPPAKGDNRGASRCFAYVSNISRKLWTKPSVLVTFALLVLSAIAIIIVRATVGWNEVNSSPMATYQMVSESDTMAKDLGGMMKSQMENTVDPEQIRYNKFSLLDDPMGDANCSAVLPLGPTAYPISNAPTANEAQCMLKKYTDSVSVVSSDDWEVGELDVDVLISSVGGPPSNPSSSETGEYWSELLYVMNMQVKRIRRGNELARIALKGFPLPFRWTGLSINGVAQQVHDEYPGSHQALMIQDLMSGIYGRLELDSSIIPQRSRVHFLRGVGALAELNQWAIARVGPYNFRAKWHVGRARPEEVVAAIQSGFLSYVPSDVLETAKRLPHTSRPDDFTAYPEGSPRHPSWPAMHGAASGLSFWLPVVMDLTPLQHCQAKLIDFAVSHARVVAGVHYKDDSFAGLDMGQEVVAQLLPDHLANTYGADAAVVKTKVEATRFSWRDFDMEDPCPGVDWKVWECGSRKRRCGFRSPVESSV